MTPPIEPITGKDAFFIEDKFPYKIFSLISRPTFKKKKNIKKSFINSFSGNLKNKLSKMILL